MKHPEYLVDIAENMEKVRDGGQALAIRNSGVNLLPYPYAHTTKTTNGITFTDNGDGTITANGTATGNADFDVAVNYDVQYGMTIKSGLTGDSSNTYEIFINGIDGTIIRTYGNPTFADHEFVANRVILRVRPGVTVNNLIFKPSIEIARWSITDTLTNRGHRLMPEMNEILSNMNDIYQAGQESAAALKTSVSGAAISVNDVHKVEHNVGVQLKSKNLFNAFETTNSGDRNAFDTFEQSEGCVTVTSDNSSTVNSMSFNLLRKSLPKGDYVFSFNVVCENSVTGSGNSDCIYIWHNDVFYTARSLKNDGQNGSIVYKFTLTETTKVTISWYRNTSSFVTNNTIYKAVLSNIQLELGTTATEYTPYISDFTNVNPGKNLFSATHDDFINAEKLGDGKQIFFTLKPNTSYTLSSNMHKNTDGSTNIWFNGTSGGTNGVWENNSSTTITDNTGKLYILVRESKMEELFNNYWLQLEEGTTATPYEPYREPIVAEVARYGKNLFDIDTILPSFINNYGDAGKWIRQSDGSYFKGNVGTGYGDIWFENKANYKGQIAISMASKHTITEVGGLGLTLEVNYTDGTIETAIYTPMLSETYSVRTFVTNANKTVFRITQSYNSGKGMYVKDVMIAYGTDTTYKPYIKPATYTAKADGTVERTIYGKNLCSDIYSEYEKAGYASLYIADEPLIMSFTDKDTSVDISGCYIGFTVNPNNASEGFRWVIDNGTVKSANQNDAAQNGKQCPYVFVYPNDENTFNKLMQRFYIQVELGTTATPYEPYHEPVVEGVKSISPSMTLLSDTPGVVINAEYFKQK